MRPVRKADNLTTFMCRLSRNLSASNYWNAQGLSRAVQDLSYLRTGFRFKVEEVAGQWRRLCVRSFMTGILHQFYHGDTNNVEEMGCLLQVPATRTMLGAQDIQ